jgi:Ca-activated chloride channel homolog
MGKARWIGLVVVVTLLGGSRGAHAQPADQTLSPYFLVEGATDGVERFPLERTDVVANVSGVVADVTVKQTYRNDGSRPIHARYVFPASTRAAVHGMQMTIGPHRVVAKIKEREQATREFEEAKAQGKSASLLEQDRPNVFTMSVSNVLPGDRVEVELRYSELLVPDDGVYQFVYPTVVGPRYSGAPAAGAPAHDAFVASPYLHEGDVPPTQWTIRANVSTGVPLAELHCDSHAVDIVREGPARAQVSLKPNAGFGGDRDFILDYRLAGAQIQSGLLVYEGERENHFLLMVQPPARVASTQVPPREYVFVLDVSGSMWGFPLDTAKLLSSDLIAQLRPTDTFNVVLFSGDARTLSPRSLPATTENVTRALKLLSHETGGGGTELEAALRTVMAIPRSEHVARSVVVLTDGYIAHERGAFELVTDHVSDTNVFAFGIGTGVNRYLIEGLARAGQGEPFVVTDAAQARVTAERFRRYIETPVLTQVRVAFKGFGAYDVEPKAQPDLFAQRPIVVMGKYHGTATGTIEVTGRTATGTFLAMASASQALPLPEHAALPRLWARSRIARLSDYDPSGEEPAMVRAVTSLGLQYSLLTKHTSFIAVLEKVRNPGMPAKPVDQPSPLPLGVSDMAIGGGEYASGAEPELSWLLMPLLALLASRARQRRHAVERAR